MERRNIIQPVTVEKCEVTIKGEEPKEYIRGYFSTYGTDYVMWEGYIERIAAGALDGCDMSDVVCLFNHDDDRLLGRSTNGQGTLTIGFDEKGGYFEVERNDTTASKDTYENIRLGNVKGCSFAFTIENETIERGENETIVTINKIKRLYDVGPVVNPAYKDTEVEAAKRSLQTRLPEPEKAPFNAELYLLKFKI